MIQYYYHWEDSVIFYGKQTIDYNSLPANATGSEMLWSPALNWADNSLGHVGQSTVTSLVSKSSDSR